MGGGRQNVFAKTRYEKCGESRCVGLFVQNTEVDGSIWLWRASVWSRGFPAGRPGRKEGLLRTFRTRKGGGSEIQPLNKPAIAQRPGR